MKNINWILIFALIALSFIYASCQDEYDPIGNNKPVPVLKLSSTNLGFDSAGGKVSVEMETNASKLVMGDAPSWISAVQDAANSKLTVTAQINDDIANIRRGSMKISTDNGTTNEAKQNLNFIQAAQGGRLNYDSFTAKSLNKGWETNGTGEVSFGAGQLTLGPNTMLICKTSTALVSQINNVVIASVDIKAGGEGGLQLYLDPSNPNNPDNRIFVFISINDNTGIGSLYARQGPTALSLGDKIPGGNSGPMPDIPSASERDNYFRIEFSNASGGANWENVEINIYSLKTSDGETKVLKKHYMRTFVLNKPKLQLPGYFAVWARNSTCSFKNFTLSAQKN